MRTALCGIAALATALLAGKQLADVSGAIGGFYGMAATLPVSIVLGGAIGKAFGRLARTPELD